MGQTAQASCEPIAAPGARRYCQDCRFFTAENATEKRFGRCLHPKANVSGGPDAHYAFVAPEYAPPSPYASCTRASGFAGDCGPDAQWFEAAQAEAAE